MEANSRLLRLFFCGLLRSSLGASFPDEVILSQPRHGQLPLPAFRVELTPPPDSVSVERGHHLLASDEKKAPPAAEVLGGDAMPQVVIGRSNGEGGAMLPKHPYPLNFKGRGHVTPSGDVQIQPSPRDRFDVLQEVDLDELQGARRKRSANVEGQKSEKKLGKKAKGRKFRKRRQNRKKMSRTGRRGEKKSAVNTGSRTFTEPAHVKGLRLRLGVMNSTTIPKKYGGSSPRFLMVDFGADNKVSNEKPTRRLFYRTGRQKKKLTRQLMDWSNIGNNMDVVAVNGK